MIQEQKAKKGPAYNPFMAPIPTSHPVSGLTVTVGEGGVGGGEGGGGGGGNLMTSSTSAAALPVLPSHILKEVLQ